MENAATVTPEQAISLTVILGLSVSCPQASYTAKARGHGSYAESHDPCLAR